MTVEPNPVVTNAVINYQLDRSENISCAIYDATGSLITFLVNGQQAAGQHRLTWNTNGVQPGIYFCKLITTTTSATARVLIVR